ncbi:MAG: DUF11 domain-containing protein [Burkholderiaceae bacterium]|nr:DUF11 domain-containing protein [Burkholderiaceae bacterium]
MRIVQQVLRWLAMLAVLALPLGARADTPIKLFKAFAGNVSFTGTQKTMRTRSNTSDPCAVDTGTLNMVLNGLPTGSTVLSAHLYWAGSALSDNDDFSVLFDGQQIDAPVPRRYTSNTIGGTGSRYFSGAADVTTQVVAKRNATYTVGGLTIDATSTYCGSQAVLGGFQLLVIYSLPSETFRVLNIYEGLQYTRNSSLTLTLSNFQVPNPIGSLTGRVGHITWEGDATLNNSEYLKYNGVNMQDTLNSSDNQFNSASNINNDSVSYGIDFDAYTVRSPVIKADDTKADTTYQSGQDLVLMSAEIIAAPNVPATDRAITMKLSGTLAPSQTNSYVITVSNNGPLTETGPITVTDTLPSTLIYGGFSGTDWNCTRVGQKVTCSYTGSLLVGRVLPTLTLNVTTSALASGLVSNSAKVGGQLFDYDDSNNTATVSTRIGAAAFTPVYAFTDQPCTHNVPFDSNVCKQLTLQKVVANDPQRMYITFLVNGIPTSLDNADTAVRMRFALSCHNPIKHAGVQATFFNESGAGAASSLPLCAQEGIVPGATSSTWSNQADIVFAGGSASSRDAYLFTYADVGRIELLARDTLGRLGTTDPFVSRPKELVLTAPSENKASNPASISDLKFTTAGTPFTLTVGAKTGGDTPVLAPNFGKESPAAVVVLDTQLATDSAGNVFPEMATGAQPFSGSFGAFSGGQASGSFTYAEVGLIRVTARLDDDDYLGSGRVNSVSVNLGRFVPAWFDTVVVPPMPCHAKLNCPASIAGMAYSKQAFDVQVLARNAAGVTVKNYQGAFARGVTLRAYSAAKGTTENPPASSSSALSASSIPRVLANDPPHNTSFKAGVASAKPVYTFPAANAFIGTQAQARNWIAPTTIFVRATESTGSDSVTSNVGSAVESGITIVSGRLKVDHAYGSPLLQLPLQALAQYYQGGSDGWVTNTVDNVSPLAALSDVVFSNCDNRLKASNICDTAKLAVVSSKSGSRDAVSASTTVTSGVATLTMKAPGAGNVGGATVSVSNLVWLPSTLARVVYGMYNAPYIYLREIH